MLFDLDCVDGHELRFAAAGLGSAARPRLKEPENETPEAAACPQQDEH